MKQLIAIFLSFIAICSHAQEKAAEPQFYIADAQRFPWEQEQGFGGLEQVQLPIPPLFDQGQNQGGQGNVAAGPAPYGPPFGGNQGGQGNVAPVPYGPPFGGNSFSFNPFWCNSLPQSGPCAPQQAIPICCGPCYQSVGGTGTPPPAATNAPIGSVPPATATNGFGGNGATGTVVPAQPTSPPPPPQTTPQNVPPPENTGTPPPAVPGQSTPVPTSPPPPPGSSGKYPVPGATTLPPTVPPTTPKKYGNGLQPDKKSTDDGIILPTAGPFPPFGTLAPAAGTGTPVPAGTGATGTPVAGSVAPAGTAIPPASSAAPVGSVAPTGTPPPASSAAPAATTPLFVGNELGTAPPASEAVRRHLEKKRLRHMQQ